jgi:hypothetical protein
MYTARVRAGYGYYDIDVLDQYGNIIRSRATMTPLRDATPADVIADVLPRWGLAVPAGEPTQIEPGVWTIPL